MSDLTNLFTSIANAIRAKNGSTAAIAAKNFPTAISNINTKNYKLEAGSKTASSGSFTLTFSSKIIAVFYVLGTTINSSTTWRPPTYYIEPSSDFFEGVADKFDVNGLLTTPSAYVRDSTYQSYSQRVSDKSVTIKGTQGTVTSWALTYIAILEA